MKRYEDLKIGDIINYDIVLKSGKLKNESALILTKDSNT